MLVGVFGGCFFGCLIFFNGGGGVRVSSFQRINHGVMLISPKKCKFLDTNNIPIFNMSKLSSTACRSKCSRRTTDLHQLSIPDSRLVDFLSVKFDILGSTRIFFLFHMPHLLAVS